MYVSEYTPLLHIPEKGNPYYNTKDVGGYSPCIIGNIPRGASDKVRTGYPGLNTLPNCTALATGHFNQIGGYGYIKYFDYRYYARDFVRAAKRYGLEVTEKPTVGGIMVWSGGNSGAGHVAISTILNTDGSVVTAESEWNGVPFRNYVRRIGDGNWRQGCYWMNSSYKYLGCVKNPAIQEDDIVTYEQWKEFMKQYEAERAQEPASNYAKASLEWVEQNGIMLGSNGEMMPKSPVTREQLATVLNRYNDACGDPLGETLITDDF